MRLLDSKFRRLISGMIFRTWEDQCIQLTMYCTKKLELFHDDNNVELFWATFDPSVATLSINYRPNIYSG